MQVRWRQVQSTNKPTAAVQWGGSHHGHVAMFLPPPTTNIGNKMSVKKVCVSFSEPGLTSKLVSGVLSKVVN